MRKNSQRCRRVRFVARSSYTPLGLGIRCIVFPALARWAKILRASGPLSNSPWKGGECPPHRLHVQSILPDCLYSFTKTGSQRLHFGFRRLRVVIEIRFNTDAFRNEAGAAQRLPDEMDHFAVSDQVKVVSVQSVALQERRNVIRDVALQTFPYPDPARSAG